MNLLIVDDDPICNYINVRVAEKSGLFSKIVSVSNGEAAADTILSAPPDVVLLDLNMPLMSGFDFVRDMRQRANSQTRMPAIVVVTSSNNERDLQMARELGIHDYLMKPLTAKDLHTAIFSISQRSGQSMALASVTP